MRCSDAKQSLSAQRDDGVSDAVALQEHMRQCTACRAFAQRQRQIDMVLNVSAPRVRPNISTEDIMRAVQQQRRITQQLEDIRRQQRTRIERMRKTGTIALALGFFLLGSLPLLLLAITIVQTDFALGALAGLNGIVDVLFILAQYTQTGLTLVTRDNWLLSAVAFAVVIMMGMWLRLMRHPQGA